MLIIKSVMSEVLATVNINIGLGSKNPTLTIRASDNLADLINKLISDYQLPRTVHAIIMDRVQQELAKNPPAKPKLKPKIDKKSTISERNRSVSPLRTMDRSPRNVSRKSPLHADKENNQNNANKFNQTTKIPIKKAVSPLKQTTNVPVHKKV